MTEPMPGQENELKTRWSRLRQRRWFRWTFDLLLIAAVIGAFSAWQGRHLLDRNEPAPGFALEGMDGAMHRLDDYRGERTFVVFWAPWCPICGAESGNVSRVGRWRRDKLNVLSVVLDYQSRDSVQRFMDKHGVDYPVLLGDDSVRDDFNIEAFPTLYVINADGTIRRSAVGYTTTAGMLWRALL